MNILLVKHGGPSKAPAIQQAQRCGDTCVVDEDARVPCDVRLVQVDRISVASVLRAIRQFETPPDAVFTYVDPVIQVASEVADQLGLPTLPPTIAAGLKSKLRMRQVLADAGIDYPPFARVADVSTLRAAARRVGMPVVLKPATGGAYSLGVARIDREEDLEGRFAMARGELESSQFSRFFSGGDAVTWMLEAYMPGTEISVELLGRPELPVVLNVHEKVITEQDGHFREDRFVTAPHVLTTEQLRQARQAAIRVATALGFERGVGHLEMRVTDHGAYPIELQAVPGGAMVSEMTEWSRGVNLHALHARSFLASEVPSAPRLEQLGFCAMDVLYADRPGTYRIRGMDQAERVEGILRVKIPVVDRVRVSQPFAEYLGFLVARAATATEALAILDAARSRLQVEPLEDGPLEDGPLEDGPLEDDPAGRPA